MKLNPNTFEALDELASVCDPLKLQILVTADNPDVFIVSLPKDTVHLERAWYYWIVNTVYGLSKESTIKLCSSHGQVVRALGYGRTGLTVTELKKVFDTKYHRALGSRCFHWHVDTLEGLSVLFETLLEEGNE